MQIMSHDFNKNCSVNMMCQSDDTVTPHGGIPALVIKYTGMKFRVHDLRDAVELLDMQQGKLVFRGKLLFLAERHGVVDESTGRSGVFRIFRQFMLLLPSGHLARVAELSSLTI